MLEELLDDGLIKRPQLEKPGLVNWSAFILLWAGIGWSITSGYLTAWPLLLGMAALAITTLLFYLQYRQSAILLLGASLLGAAGGGLMFFPISFSVGFIWLLPLDLTPILILVLLLATNWETYRDLYVAIRGDRQEVATEVRAAKTNRFLKTFRNKSKRELETIVAENRLVPEAVRAAAELLTGKEDVE